MKPKDANGHVAKTTSAVPPVIRAFQIWNLKALGPNNYCTFSGADCLRLSHMDNVRRNIREDRRDGILMPKFKVGFNEHHLNVAAPRRFRHNWVSSNGDGTRGKRAWVRMELELVGGEFHPDIAR